MDCALLFKRWIILLAPCEKQYVQGVLSDGQEVAVKKLLGTGHGLDQLYNEIKLLAELQHKNLVRLQGFCLHQEQTLLVYEYLKNRSLDNFLFGNLPSHSSVHK